MDAGKPSPPVPSFRGEGWAQAVARPPDQWSRVVAALPLNQGALSLPPAAPAAAAHSAGAADVPGIKLGSAPKETAYAKALAQRASSLPADASVIERNTVLLELESTEKVLQDARGAGVFVSEEQLKADVAWQGRGKKKRYTFREDIVAHIAALIRKLRETVQSGDAKAVAAKKVDELLPEDIEYMERVVAVLAGLANVYAGPLDTVADGGAAGGAAGGESVPKTSAEFGNPTTSTVVNLVWTFAGPYATEALKTLGKKAWEKSSDFSSKTWATLAAAAVATVGASDAETRNTTLLSVQYISKKYLSWLKYGDPEYTILGDWNDSDSKRKFGEDIHKQTKEDQKFAEDVIYPAMQQSYAKSLYKTAEDTASAGVTVMTASGKGLGLLYRLLEFVADIITMIDTSFVVPAVKMLNDSGFVVSETTFWGALAFGASVAYKAGAVSGSARLLGRGAKKVAMAVVPSSWTGAGGSEGSAGGGGGGDSEDEEDNTDDDDEDQRNKTKDRDRKRSGKREKKDETKQPAADQPKQPMSPEQFREQVMDSFLDGRLTEGVRTMVEYMRQPSDTQNTQAPGADRAPSAAENIASVILDLPTPDRIIGYAVGRVYDDVWRHLAQQDAHGQALALGMTLLGLYCSAPAVAKYVKPRVMQNMLMWAMAGMYAEKSGSRINFSHLWLVSTALKNTAYVLGPGVISSTLLVLPTLVDGSMHSARRAMYAFATGAYYTVYGAPKNLEMIHAMDPKAGADWIFRNNAIKDNSRSTAIRDAGDFLFGWMNPVTVVRLMWNMPGWSVGIFMYLLRRNAGYVAWSLLNALM